MARKLKLLASMLLFWTAIAFAAMVPGLGGLNSWSQQFVFELTMWWSWGVVSYGILLINEGPASYRQPLWRRVAVHVATLSATVVVHPSIALVIQILFSLLGSRQPSVKNAFVTAFRNAFWSSVMYCLILGIIEANRYRRAYLESQLRHARLEREFVEAKLLALRSQLDPHFLFNALHTVSAFVESDPDAAQDMLESIGDLLRRPLRKSQAEVTLGEELAFLDCYLRIQAARFGDRLFVYKDVPDELLRAAIPSLVLQPLVENAIRHGIGVRASGGSVWVSARQCGDLLELSVRDNGVGLPKQWPNVELGLGINSTKERISTLYPQRSAFAVERIATGGTVATISWPLRELEAYGSN